MLCTAYLISSDSPTFHAMLVMTQNAPVDPEFNSPGFVAGVSYKSPSEPPQQKSEAGSNLPGHGAHFMRSPWPWTDTGLKQVQAAATYTHFMGGGGWRVGRRRRPRTAPCKPLEDAGCNQVLEGA